MRFARYSRSGPRSGARCLMSPSTARKCSRGWTVSTTCFDRPTWTSSCSSTHCRRASSPTARLASPCSTRGLFQRTLYLVLDGGVEGGVAIGTSGRGSFTGDGVPAQPAENEPGAGRSARRHPARVRSSRASAGPDGSTGGGRGPVPGTGGGSRRQVARASAPRMSGRPHAPVVVAISSTVGPTLAAAASSAAGSKP